MNTQDVNPAVAPPNVIVEPTKEIRFAVVMYGGVSLAIYINGVAQELLRMVRSTAAAGTGTKKRTALSGAEGTSAVNSLRGTERVYRKLSHLLSDEELLQQFQTRADEVGEDRKKAEAVMADLEELATDNSRPVATTFIVDILSGTSAGGINSIYLAKALANEQRMDRLKQLWINEGDIELLLNDTRSLEGVDLSAQDPPVSLLNSRRLYWKLLRALDDMDQDNPSVQGAASPYATELDLFITTTDIEGVSVPLKLSDKIVYERRHRNVFHFEYQEAERVNDFLADTNPFLAFAARCTSSFPFAFEPMRLMDIDEVLDLMPDYRDKPQCKSDSPKWKRYFKEIIDPQTGVPNLRLERRSFGDGGYLDNKPFSYAIEALVRRQSDVPVERRLIYIEPSPEHPEDVPERDFKPDALQNVKSALLDLPAYETIREDLQRVLQRNLLIERVQRIVSSIEKDANDLLPAQLAERLRTFQTVKPETSAPVVVDQERPMWEQKNLTTMVTEKGRSFLSYRKLRISAVTDEIARLLARLLDFDADSDLLLSLRCLVRAWRESNYFDDREPTLNQFLTDFDLSHRIRRLNFIRERIDRLYNYDRNVQLELDKFGKKYSELEPSIKPLSAPELRKFRDKNADIGWMLGLLRSSRALSNFNASQRYELRSVLILMKSEVNKVYKEMQASARKLRLRSSQQEKDRSDIGTNPLLKPFQDIGITVEYLKAIIDTKNLQRVLKNQSVSSTTGTPNEDDCLLVAHDFLDHNLTDLNLKLRLKAAVEELKQAVGRAVVTARERTGVLLNPKAPFEPESDRGKEFMAGLDEPLKWQSSDIVWAVREYLAYYHYNFEEYDQISFPIFYEADVGEASVVEVIRVSPEDATSLIDERKERRESPDGKGRKKLAGTALHHFGAFLDRTWRQNDIMWGRLDGFERLIMALLPGPQNESLRRLLIKAGHTSILIDELPPENRLQLGGLVSEALIRTSAGEPVDDAVARVTGELTSASPVRTRLEAIIRATLENEELLDFIKVGYEVNRKLDPKPLLSSLSRSTQIIGKLFESLANENQLDGSSLKWVARLGQLFWGLVEVAVPNSIRNLLWNRWLSVVYAFEFFIIIAGLLLASSGAQQFGWTALGITGVLNIFVLVLKDILRGRHALFRLAGVFVFLVILLLATLGFLELLGPIFGVHWGTGENTYPMTWVKETVKQVIPVQLWPGSPLFNLGVLITIIAVIVLLNGVSDLVDFSRLNLRWRLLVTWWNQSNLRSYIPWGRFKLIKISANDLERRTKLFPGKENLFILPFTLSSDPSSEWVWFFENSFRKQQENLGSQAQQLSTNGKQIVVVSTGPELTNLFARLSASVSTANEECQNAISKRARTEYENQKRLLQMKAASHPLASENVPVTISSELEEIRVKFVQKLSTWTKASARALGFLTISLSVLIGLGLASSRQLMSQHPVARLPGGLQQPALSFELSRSGQEAQQVIEAQGVLVGTSASDHTAATLAGKSALTRNIMIDWLVIPMYVITLGALCLWIAFQSREDYRWLGVAAAISVLGAGFFDVLENIRILELLRTDAILSTDLSRLRFATTLKWACLFLMLGFLSRNFWKVEHSFLKWVGLYLVLPVVLGTLGLLGVRIAIEWAFWLMALGLFPIGLFVLIWPERFREA